ncbi:MAG: hypothetical protein JO323_18190 [Acidobacteriia bacterium]|nr:hypothetical protein [Terriglobia bacterium]
MKHWILSRRGLALAALAALALTGCKRKEAVKVSQTETETPPIASLIHTGDPNSDTQLVTGFYPIEEHSWRWTAQHFSVVLRPPAGSAERGATLSLQLNIPEPVLAKLKTVALSAVIGGVMLPPETYTKPGPYTYTRDVPSNALNVSKDAVRVDFQLDKAIPPSAGGDQRELGVIVAAVGLDAK